MDLIRDGAEPEIRHLQITVVIDEEILRLQITVKDAARVAITDGGDQLLEILTAKIFVEPTFGNLGEELAALDELHDEVDLGLAGQNLEELDDVGVAQAAHDSDLALDVRH